jgi:hypothetical protein
MISVKTKVLLEDSQIINFKIPENIKLKTGEYEIVVVINTNPIKKTKNRKLTFSDHNYCLENQNSTFNRSDIYGDFF